MNLICVFFCELLVKKPDFFIGQVTENSNWVLIIFINFITKGHSYIEQIMEYFYWQYLSFIFLL